MIVLRVTPTIVTRQRFQLDFFVDGSSWEGFFDRIEVWRSRGTDQGPYECLHDDAWYPARLPDNTYIGLPPSPPESGPQVPVVGQTLSFLINETTPVTITFTGSNPLSFNDAATQIQTQAVGLLTAFVAGNILYVQTVEPGAKAILRCVGGNAAPLLGLPTSEPGSLAFGRDARIVLRHGVESYSFVDPSGSMTYFYKARFFNTFTRTVSAFSLPFQGTPMTGLALANLCRAYVDLVDMAGEPAEGWEVLVANRFNGTQVAGRTVIGGNQRLLTDCKGHAEILLARGTNIVVGIGGTDIARDVTIPTDPTVVSLNLLADASGQNDVFTVQVPHIPYAVKRTL